ncbi:hypothetical protein CU669_20670, partial [Paramagnetospirillum kuznetsovii]
MTPSAPEKAASTAKADDVVIPQAHVGAPNVVVSDVTGNEDDAIALTIKVSASDAGDSVSQIMIYGVPTGGILNHGNQNADGSWTLTTSDLNGLTLTPPHDFGGTISLEVSASATDSGLSASSGRMEFDVSVLRVADAPSLTLNQARGNEDAAIALDISPHLSDTDGSESISAVTITGVPSGATLNHGVHNADGSWTLSSADLAGLKITPATNDAHDFTLTVTATSTEQAGDPNPIAVGRESATSAPVTLSVTVDATAHTPALVQTAPASGNEDSRINLNLTEALTASNESLTLTVSGVPTGSHFYASAIGGAAIGHDNGDGSWSFTSAEVAQAQG